MKKRLSPKNARRGAARAVRKSARKLRATYTIVDVHRRCGAELIEPLEETRQIIRQTVPNARERVYKDGAGIGYHVPGVGVRFGIFFTKTSVALVFPWGELLPDPEHLIDGHAKKSSWVNIRPGKPINQEALSRLILASLMD